MAHPCKRKPKGVVVPPDADPLTIQQRAFCAAYAICGTIKHASERAGICRQLHSKWIAQCPAYAQAFAEAYEDAGDNAEFRMRELAFKGSERLLLEVVRAHKPEKYRQRVDTRVSGGDGGPLRADVRAIADRIDADPRLAALADQFTEALAAMPLPADTDAPPA